MRYLILSDLHGNKEALEAVLADAETEYDQIVCCGDLVGYGADPDAVTEWVRGHVTQVVRGNHDKACAGLEELEWFNPVAREAILWTQQNMDANNLGYLHALPKGPMRVDGFEILHGSPLDEDEYVATEHDVAQIAPYLETAVSFFGHTHLQGGFLCHRNGIKRLTHVAPDSNAETIELEKDSSYLINPGSVGQPRDGDPRAAYAIYQTEGRLVTLCRTEYDIAAAQKKILEAGLPEILALRLNAGV